MLDRLDIVDQADVELKNKLKAMAWPLDYGTVKVQIRGGKPTLITIERTIKMD